MLRDMERDGVLAKEPYQRPNRSWAERWMVMRDPERRFEKAAHGAQSGTQ